MNQWAIDGPTLVLRRNGTDFVPTADEIYSSVIEEAPPWPDVPPGKSGIAINLNFSRFPADVRIFMKDCAEGGMPGTALMVQPQYGSAFGISIESLQAGHVVEAGTWFPFTPSNVSIIARLLREGDVDGSGTISSFRGFLALKKAAESGEPVTDLTSSNRQIKTWMLRRGEDGPSGIVAKLYDYQVEGWKWLSFILREELGALLADEMGLGKTLQVISAVNDPGTSSTMYRSLIVAPGSLLENWKREINKFCPSLGVLKHQGSMRTGRPKDLEQFDVVITSYDTVVRDLSLLKMIDWSVVALDEAQNIKNPKAKRTLSVKQLPRLASLVITGTPVENRLTDLWSIMDFALPGYLGSLKEFSDTYDDGVDAAVRIEPLISPLMLRRRISEVASDLPERIDIPEIIELSEAESQAYDRIRQAIMDDYGQSATLVSLTRLRQFCAHPSLLTAHETKNLLEEFTKFARLLEITEEIIQCKEKAIIFTSYTNMADKIAALVRNRFDTFAEVFDGRTPIDDRQPLIDRFSKEAGSGVLVLNPKAGGAGLNITAATHVVHYNLEWNPALEDQASARAHRKGQTRPVMVRRLICEGTVEEIVENRVQRKRRISKAAVIGVNGTGEEYADLMAALAQSPIKRGNS